MLSTRDPVSALAASIARYPRLMKSLRLIATVALLLVILLAGCSGSSDGSTPDVKPASTAKADRTLAEVCPDIMTGDPGTESYYTAKTEAQRAAFEGWSDDLATLIESTDEDATIAIVPLITATHEASDPSAEPLDVGTGLDEAILALSKACRDTGAEILPE